MAVVVAGLYRNQDQEGRDRANFNLPPGQAELIQAVCKANPRTVVVLNGGSPSSVDPWLENCGALMMYWYGGTEGGNALARVLFGEVNPSGHLPCTWPKKIADSPAHSTGNAAEYPGVNGAGGGGRGAAMSATGGPQENYSEGILVGLSLVRREEDRAAVPLRIRAFLYHVCRFRPQSGSEPQLPAGSTLGSVVTTVTATSPTRASATGRRRCKSTSSRPSPRSLARRGNSRALPRWPWPPGRVRRSRSPCRYRPSPISTRTSTPGLRRPASTRSSSAIPAEPAAEGHNPVAGNGDGQGRAVGVGQASLRRRAHQSLSLAGFGQRFTLYHWQPHLGGANMIRLQSLRPSVSPPKLRSYQYSLRTLMLVVTLPAGIENELGRLGIEVPSQRYS